MQAVGLESGQCEYTFELDTSQQGTVEGTLGRLCQVKSPSIVNIYQYHSRPNSPTTRTYSIIADVVGEKLSDLSTRRQAGAQAPISPEELSNLAIACIRAMAVVQEKVRTRQQLGIQGLADEVIYVTAAGSVRVNLLYAVLERTQVAIPQVLYQAANYAFAEDPALLRTVVERLNPEIQAVFPNVMAEIPDYRSISSHFQAKSAPSPIECRHCGQLRVASIAQICENHKFCSEACLSAVKSSAGLQGSQCPLCTVKINRPRKVIMVQKQPAESKIEESPGKKCAKCGKEYECNSSEGWRLDKLGSSEYEQVKLFCSERCYLQGKQPQREESKAEIALLCVVCGQNAARGKVLHCRQHGICSPHCLSRYYHSEALTPHQYADGSYICYQCLEQSLAEVGPGEGLPEIQALRRKLAHFKGAHRGGIKGDEHLNHSAGCQCTYVDCGWYLTPDIMRLTNFQTFCIFCDIPIRITKHMEKGFVLSEEMPFFISCEFRIHAICSRTCLRSRVPNPEDPKAFRCPRCSSSLFSAEAVILALNAENPTIECFRRISMSHHCASGAPTFVLDGCRHEICSAEIDSHVGEDGRVYCNMCGNSAPLEDAISSQFKLTIKFLRDG